MANGLRVAQETVLAVSARMQVVYRLQADCTDTKVPD
jgi:hypothetical protein